MSTRYDTLNVSLQQNNNRKKLNKTIDIPSEKDDEQSKPENDDRANKFKELYYKNEKLRKELKLLNEKLNEKLEKLKLPSVKKKAMSVDLNHNPPSKALQRELQNAYKQVTMYKKQVEGLKGKQQTAENYEKLRNTQNMIGYMDMEINQVQEQLKSIKNVKKLQQKILTEDVENVQLKQRLIDYQNQIKSFKEKIKEIDKKSKKREQDFKRQQAYLVALEQKLRKFHAEQKQLEKQEPQKPKQATEQQFKIIKDEITWSKAINDELTKKIEQMKKTIKNTKQQKYLLTESLKQKENLHKQLLIQVETFTRLLKDLQIKRYEQTGVKAPQQMKGNSKFLKLEQIQDDLQRNSITDTKNKELEASKFSSPNNSFHSPTQFSLHSSHPATKGERQWKGKMRKISKGYTIPTDEIFQQSGIILGLRVFFDENSYATGISAIMKTNNIKVQSKVYGTATPTEQRWECPQNDGLARITGSFSEQGYLSEITLITKTGMGIRLGNNHSDAYEFNLEVDQTFSGFFGGIRRLGQDTRITEIGFWISKL